MHTTSMSGPSMASGPPMVALARGEHVFECRQIQSEAVFLVLGKVGFGEISPRRIKVVHMSITNVADPVRIVQQCHKKRCIIEREAAKHESFCFNFNVNQRKLPAS